MVNRLFIFCIHCFQYLGSKEFWLVKMLPFMVFSTRENDPTTLSYRNPHISYIKSWYVMHILKNLYGYSSLKILPVVMFNMAWVWKVFALEHLHIHQFDWAWDLYTELFEMIVGVLRTATLFSRCNPMRFLSMGLRHGSNLCSSSSCSSSSRKYPRTQGVNQNRHWNHHRWHATNSFGTTRLSCWCL